MSTEKRLIDIGDREQYPMADGLMHYFPDALAYVAHVSKVGNDQHNPGEPMHWARGKSTNHPDKILRHQMSAGTEDTDGTLHSGKVAWRALAQLQEELERRYGLTPPRNAKMPDAKIREHKDNDGWREWGGGQQPVADEVKVDVVLKYRAEIHGVAAESLRWSHDGDAGDIVAWRPAKGV